MPFNLSSSVRSCAFFFLSLYICILFFNAAANASSLDSKKEYPSSADRLLESGGFLVQKAGETILEKNAGKRYIPASILKIVTALGAFEILGADFRFQTEFYQNEAGDLLVRGLGDPFLVSEEVDLIMDRLKDNGVKVINNILLDDSSFQLEEAVDGSGRSLNPYDVMNSALVVNFNTVNINVSGDMAVRSAEPQTPTLPLMRELGGRLPPGTHRINISNNRRNILRYVGEIFRAAQQKKGISGSGTINAGQERAGFRPVYSHRSSKDMQSIVQGLMLYSNNFIANQLFLACGVKRFGYPATWEKGRDSFHDFLLQSLGLDQQAIYMEEGSGLSRKNRMTPAAMAKVLDGFRPYARLMPFEHGRFIKSGTLTDVYSYAGYFKNGKGLDDFVLILNQKKNYRDRLLDILEKKHRQSD